MLTLLFKHLLLLVTILQSGKNHTIGENLIFPSIKDVIYCMFGETYVKKNAILLSNDTISHRIKEISNDIEKTILKNINDTHYDS